MLTSILSVLLVAIVIGILWIALVLYGKRFALRDRLQKADAIVVLAGTRGNIKFLQGKIATAVRLYQQGWASTIICTGKFSVKVAETPNQMRRIILVTSPFHQQRTYLTFAKVFQSHGIQISNYYAEADEWHPLAWFFSAQHRRLVKSEKERIKVYRAKGDLI